MRRTFELLCGLAILVFMLLVLLWILTPQAEAPTHDAAATSDEPTLPTEENELGSTPDDVEPVQQPDNPDEMAVCTMDAKLCPDGSYVGRVGPDCAFAACPTITEPVDDVVMCDPDNRPKECDDSYEPVCAAVQVECITTPCNPVPETKSNGCYACSEDRVLSYTTGACQ